MRRRGGVVGSRAEPGRRSKTSGEDRLSGRGGGGRRRRRGVDGPTLRAAALRLLQSCCGKRCSSDDALVIDESGAKAIAKALQNASGAGAVALLTWLAKHAEACDVGDALASPLITRLYDKARAPKDAALECVTALVQKGALDRSSLENALDAAPIVGRRVVAQLLEGVFREASPIKVVKRVPKASPLPAAFDFGVADDASTPVVEAASPTRSVRGHRGRY